MCIDPTSGLFAIQTNEGRLVLDVVQKAGGKPLPIKEFLRGTQF